MPTFAGIGLEVALQFLREGEKVVLSSRSIDQLPKDNPEIRKFVDSGNAHLQEADLSTVRSCLHSEKAFPNAMHTALIFTAAQHCAGTL